MKTITSFERFGAACAIIAGIVGFGYSVSFVLISRSAPELGAILSPLFLLLGGLLATAALVAVYNYLRETEPAFALWALLLGVVAALGSAIHGGYDLANALNPPSVGTEVQKALLDFPSQIDPRGLLTFGVAGLALLIISWLVVNGRSLPKMLGYLGYLSAVLLLLIYLGRLIILDPKNPLLLGSATLEGFLVNPIWYLWLGFVLWRMRGYTKD